jgi:hypothetical protein
MTEAQETVIKIWDRLGEYYVRVDKGGPDKPITYWLPVE